MYLESLKIWNFRKYGASSDNGPGIEVHFHDGVNVLVGENDSGKTSIIDAIRYVLHTRSGEPIYLDEKDFFEDADCNRAKSLKIECLFKGITPQEAAPFLEWMGLSKYENGNAFFVLRLVLTARRQEDGRIFSQVKAGMGNDGTIMAAEARDLLKAVYLKPLRDASQDMTHGYKSRIAQILQAHTIFGDDKKDENGRHHLENQYLKLKQAIDDYFDPQKGQDGKDITNIINNDLMKNFLLSSDSRNARLSLTGNDLTDILHQLDLRLEENKSGLGTLNLLCVAAELLLFIEKTQGVKITLVEEIEAHLHPQYQLRLIDYIQEESKFGQFILTTHSITIGSNIPLKNLILLKGCNAYPMDEGSTCCGESDYSFLQRFLDATKANLFFARGVILVEGDAENLLLPTIAKIIGLDLHSYGVSIVNVGSTAYERYTKIFQRKDGQSLNIPVSIITDLDIRSIEYYNDVNMKKVFHCNDTVKSDLTNLCSKIDFSNLPSYIESWSELEDYINENKRPRMLKADWEKVKSYYDNNLTGITAFDITEMRERRSASLLKKYNGSSDIKIFIPKEWTLEYEIARSSIFKELAAAILLAKDNKGSISVEKAIEEANKKYESDTSSESIAYEIFEPLNDGRVSKAITAQYLAEILNREATKYKSVLEYDEHLHYLIEAIKHVTTPHNE